MNEDKQNYKGISKNGLIENAKATLINKFGFIPHHKRVSSDNINNNILILSKTSISNSKNNHNNIKLKLNLLGIEPKTNNYKNNKNIQASQSCNSLNNKVNYNNNKKNISRNYNEIQSNITNNTSKTKTNYSTFFNNKPKFFKTLQSNYKHSYSITNEHNKEIVVKKDNKKNENKIKNKNVLCKEKNSFNEIALNFKPVIKKNDNLIYNRLWSKLITNIDQKQNNKINNLKKKCLNQVNINNNTNININIKNDIVNSPEEKKEKKENNENNENIIENIHINKNNICFNNLEINNVNINNNNSLTVEKNYSKNYLPDMSLNDITNCNPPEKDNSTISINEEYKQIKKESKKNFNKIIQERQNEKNKNSKKITQRKSYEKDRNKSPKDIISVKNENKLHKIYSSSLFDDSNMDNIINHKREIKYCNSDTFKTINDKNDNNNKKEKEDKKETKNNENNSIIHDISFIGDSNSYNRLNKKTLEKDSYEKGKKNNNNNESDFTESNNRNIFTNYNYNKYNNNNNICNIYNNSTYQSDNLKIYRLLSRNYSYNVSSRDIQEESAKKINRENQHINYQFITEIEKKNINIINLNKKKFLNLNDKCIFKILSFGLDLYLPLLHCDKYIKNKINKSFNNIFNNIINDFKIKYKDYLEVIHYKFEQNKIKSFYKNNEYILDLILVCKIISKNIGQSIEISCNYLSNNKKYDYLWKFDLQKKTKINKWIATEINAIKNYHKTISYTSQVSAFSYGDEIQLEINIFNINNSLEPSSLEWYEIIISPVSPGVYETTKFINNISYDPLRACEVEKQILLWHDNINNEHMDVYEDIKKIFNDFFKIKKIYYDKSKFFFYKIIMVPYKLGIILRNKYCSFDINIIDLDSPIKNEIQCIYFINTNSYTNKMDIRIGSTLTLYIIDMKSN